MRERAEIDFCRCVVDFFSQAVEDSKKLPMESEREQYVLHTLTQELGCLECSENIINCNCFSCSGFVCKNCGIVFDNHSCSEAYDLLSECYDNRVQNTITRTKGLYKTKVEYGNYCLNYLMGCKHQCAYCYSYKNAFRYKQVEDELEWRDFKIVENILTILDREIPMLKKDIESVHLCFTTDPFMFDSVNNCLYPQVQSLTLNIIEKLNQAGLKVTTLTKGLYPLDLVQPCFSRDNEYGITLTSLNLDYKLEWEQYSSPYERRIKSLKRLSLNGKKTWVSIEPYPTPNMVVQDLEEILNKVDFVDKIIFGQMNYVPLAKEFKDREFFYRECVAEVVQFCHERNIAHHIKENTPRPPSVPQTSVRMSNQILNIEQPKDVQKPEKALDYWLKKKNHQ